MWAQLNSPHVYSSLSTKGKKTEACANVCERSLPSLISKINWGKHKTSQSECINLSQTNMHNHEHCKQTWNFTVNTQRPQFKIAINTRRHSHRHLVFAWRTARTEYYTAHCRLMRRIHTGVEDEADHIISQIYNHRHNYKPEPNCILKNHHLKLTQTK